MLTRSADLLVAWKTRPMCLLVMEDIRGPTVITEGSLILFKGKIYEGIRNELMLSSLC